MGCFGMKMCNSPEGIARRAGARRAKLDGLVAEMHAAYEEGLSLSEVGRRFGGRGPTAVRNLFELRGLPIRVTYRNSLPRKADGSFEKKRPLTDAEVDTIVATATDYNVTPALAFTWRHWTIARRGEHIARLRARLGPPNDRPTTPYSSNVEFFDYGSEHAHAIQREMNQGRDSRTKLMQLRTCSEGVIFEGSLWFWKKKTGYAKGPLRQGTLHLLHHRIWSGANDGRPVPSDHVLRFIDGNPNNLVPENIRLVSRDEVCRENQAIALTAKSRALTALLLNRSQTDTTYDSDTLIDLRRR